jgi:hypothetical protein
LAVDKSGNIFVADSGNNTIRKITSTGVVSTLAGLAGSYGSADGAGSNARFFNPGGVAVDSAGNVYVADRDNHTVRRITPAGVVSTLAGLAGSRGNTDGVGYTARFDGPAGVAIDSTDNVFVADGNNNTIRKITPAGIVSTFAGLAGSYGNADGARSTARFDGPEGLAIDSVDNVYVADSINDTIRKITPAGLVSTFAGRALIDGSADGSNSNARFFNPCGVAVDSAGNIYVADTLNHTVRKAAAPDPVPQLLTQPCSQVVPMGVNATIAVVPNGTAPLSYQWKKGSANLADGGNISGATGATLILANVQLADAGSSSVIVANSAGTVTSNAVTLTVSDVARLSAISCRAVVGAGDNVLIPGIIISGSGSKQVIVRASGPALISPSVSGTLAQPQLSLYSGSAVIAQNIGWSSGTAANTSALQAAFTQAGLSQFPNGSADCALLATLTPGIYTAVISGVNNSTGVALVEVYELGAGSSNLSAISCRAVVGTDSNVLIPGIIIGGSGSKQVLVRASGPALITLGVAGTLAQPQLSLYSGSTVIAQNTGWSSGTAADTSALQAAVTQTGLTPFPVGSADCALLATLSPGAYTAIISGVNNTSGIALIEVYEVP